MRDRRREFTGFGETGAEETRDLLDEGIGGNEGVVLAGELFDELFVLVEFLEVVGGHGVDAVVLGAVDVVLVTKDTVGKVWLDMMAAASSVMWKVRCNSPDAHARPRHLWQLDGTGETLVALRIIVLEADLEFDGLEEVPLLRLVGVFEKLLDIRTHSGDSDFRHDGLSSRKTDEVSLVRILRLEVVCS